jgi:hypothetical protein
VNAWPATSRFIEEPDGTQELPENCVNRGIGQSSALEGDENRGSDRIDALSGGKIAVDGMLRSFMERAEACFFGTSSRE